MVSIAAREREREERRVGESGRERGRDRDRHIQVRHTTPTKGEEEV